MLLALASAGGSTLFISSKINAMREAHQTQTDEFKKTHGLSNVIYLGQTALVLIAGVVNTLSIRPRTTRA
ncbi:MAG: hypothetical protein QM770_21155 [Tepidisphaeraceae bacterium]